MSVDKRGNPLVNDKQVRILGKLLVDLNYDFPLLLKRLGSACYQPGSEFGVFPPVVEQHLGKQGVVDMSEGFKIHLTPEAEAGLHEEPIARQCRLLKVAEQSAKGCKTPESKGDTMAKFPEEIKNGWIIILPTKVAVKFPNLLLSTIHMLREGPGKTRKIQNLSEEQGCTGISVNSATDAEPLPLCAYGVTSKALEVGLYNYSIEHGGGEFGDD